MKINLQTIQAEIDQGRVRSYRHPVLPITGYNYTPECSYNRKYNAINSKCRGLCISDDGTILNNPLDKFYNWEEPETNKQFDFSDIESCLEKEDGSCIIIFWAFEQWICTTRGSFNSTQARAAQEQFTAYNTNKENAPTVPLVLNSKEEYKEYTWLFELVGPSNVNVTRGYQVDELRLLAARHTATGIELTEPELNRLGIKRPRTIYKDFNFDNTITWVKNNPDPNFEGIVVKLRNGIRFKVKSHLYCQLHKALTGTWTRSRILEWWLDSRNNTLRIDPLIPDEFYDDIRNRIQECEIEWQTLWKYVQEQREIMINLNYSRKDFAIKHPEVQWLLTAFFSHKDNLAAWENMALNLFVKQYA